MRAFVAIDLPETLKSRADALTGLPKGAKPVRGPQLHLTLRFLGDVDEAAVEKLDADLGAIEVPSFSLTTGQPGMFPPKGSPHVLWLGLEASPPLMQLQAAIEAAAQKLGLPPEQRDFSPHITLARLKSVDRAALEPITQAIEGWGPISFEVRSFILYQSTLSSAGAVHTPIRSYRLA